VAEVRPSSSGIIAEVSELEEHPHFGLPKCNSTLSCAMLIAKLDIFLKLSAERVI
jgi:hypothetical protein